MRRPRWERYPLLDDWARGKGYVRATGGESCERIDLRRRNAKQPEAAELRRWARKNGFIPLWPAPDKRVNVPPLTAEQAARVAVVRSAPFGCDAFGRPYRSEEPDPIVSTMNAMVGRAFYAL